MQENSKSLLSQLQSNIEIEEPPSALSLLLKAARQENRQLTVKLGVDPTAPDLHLGHSVVLQKLSDFQRAGHKIVLIIGDFTASIGDPTGRNQARPPLSAEQIEFNAQTYLDQVGKFIDVANTDVRWNSEWLGKLNLSNIVKLLGNVTLAQILQREDFKIRHRSNQPISLHELLYPLLQAYDSVAIEADIELGGTDQLFNNLMGRSLQRSLGKKQQIILCMPLLVGTDGIEKMSKSKDNQISLMDKPADMFGKVMSIPDTALSPYVQLISTWHITKKTEALGPVDGPDFNPMKLKLDLAQRIVARFHSNTDSIAAQEHFRTTYQDKREIHYDEFKISSLPSNTHRSLIDIVIYIEPTFSRSHVRRLVRQSGIKVEGLPVLKAEDDFVISKGQTLSIGKHKHYRFV